jgi:hypothetical protein
MPPGTYGEKAGFVERGDLMTCRIQNLTRRLVSIRGNSGESWHLPPQVAIDLMDAEVTHNAMIDKLVARGVIGLQAIPPEESAEPVSQTQERSRRPRSQREGVE